MGRWYGLMTIYDRYDNFGAKCTKDKKIFYMWQNQTNYQKKRKKEREKEKERERGEGATQ